MMVWDPQDPPRRMPWALLAFAAVCAAGILAMAIAT